MGIPVFLRMQIKFLYFLVFISLIQVFLFLDDDLGRFRYFPFFDCCPSPFLACSIHELSAWIKIPMCWFECLGLIHASTGNQEQSRISQFRRITENWRDYVSFFFCVENIKYFSEYGRPCFPVLICEWQVCWNILLIYLFVSGKRLVSQVIFFI